MRMLKSIAMKIPEGYSEDEVLAEIEHVTHALAAHMSFGCHDTEDMAQQGCLFALEGLEKFDPERAKLRTYLYWYVRSRFINMRRKQLSRLTPPCNECPFYDPENVHGLGSGCAEFKNKQDCSKYVGWERRNASKKSLMGSFDAKEVRNEHTNSLPAYQHSDVEIQELVSKIDSELPVDLRSDFCRLRDGVSVPKHRRVKVEEAVREIVGDI